MSVGAKVSTELLNHTHNIGRYFVFSLVSVDIVKKIRQLFCSHDYEEKALLAAQCELVEECVKCKKEKKRAISADGSGQLSG